VDPQETSQERERDSLSFTGKLLLAVVCSGAFGALMTFTIQMLMEYFGHGESVISMFLGIPWELALTPTQLILQHFGKIWNIDSVYAVPRALLCWAALFNAIAAMLVVTVVGFIFRLFTREGHREQ
jgi:hypothetical protein